MQDEQDIDIEQLYDKLDLLISNGDPTRQDYMRYFSTMVIASNTFDHGSKPCADLMRRCIHLAHSARGLDQDAYRVIEGKLDELESLIHGVREGSTR